MLGDGDAWDRWGLLRGVGREGEGPETIVVSAIARVVEYFRCGTW